MAPVARSTTLNISFAFTDLTRASIRRSLCAKASGLMSPNVMDSDAVDLVIRRSLSRSIPGGVQWRSKRSPII